MNLSTLIIKGPHHSIVTNDYQLPVINPSWWHQVTHSPPPQGILNGSHVILRTPALRYQALTSRVQVELVHGVVDGLDLGHLCVMMR